MSFYDRYLSESEFAEKERAIKRKASEEIEAKQAKIAAKVEFELQVSMLLS